MHFAEPHSCSLIVAKERSLLKKKGAFFENLSYIQVHTHTFIPEKKRECKWVGGVQRKIYVALLAPFQEFFRTVRQFCLPAVNAAGSEHVCGKPSWGWI